MVRIWKIVIAIIAVIIVALTSLLVIQAYQVPVDYWMEQENGFSKGLIPWTIYCVNDGEADVDFYLVLTLENVTWAVGHNALTYRQVLSVMKFRFALHQGDTEQKTVYFSISENETIYTLELSLTLEKINFWDMVKGTRLYPITLYYDWNYQQGSYVLR